ncbi:hypothetical protein MPSEU_000562500 [Mayamaea pseudoterrestris]|nr:hypothetical protein MPSEU_000562500 [Mayamaea pseudoterrestris]
MGLASCLNCWLQPLPAGVSEFHDLRAIISTDKLSIAMDLELPACLVDDAFLAASTACSHVQDSLNFMLDAERVSLAQMDHSALATLANSTIAPNESWREKVSVWMFHVTDHMQEERSIVYFAMNILDRYCLANVKKGSIMYGTRYEKASLAAIFLAMRIAGSAQVEIADFIRMSRRGITRKHLIEAGSDIVKSLTWENRIVAPQEFLKVMIANLPSSERRASLFDSAVYLSELAICDASLSRFKASDVALAAFMNSVIADQECDSKCAIQAIRKGTPMNPDSSRIQDARNQLHRLYSLSYESIGKGIPHVISSEAFDPPPREFISSCAARSISDDNLFALNDESEKHLLKSSLAQANGFTNKRRKTY